jgi:hypothetical protein
MLVKSRTTKYMIVAMLGINVLNVGESEIALARGLDELTPAEKNPEEEKSKAGEGKAQTAAESDQEPALASSTISRKGAPWLNDKAFLEISYGLVSASGSKGDWRASGMSDVAFKYLVTQSPMDLLASVRFAPFDVTVYSDDIGYEGTVNAYYLGGEARFKVAEKVVVTGGAELGLMLVYLKDVIDIASDKSLEENGVNFSLNGGANWRLAEFMSVGPRLHLGFGSLQVVQFSVATSLMF